LFGLTSDMCGETLTKLQSGESKTQIIGKSSIREYIMIRLFEN